MTDNVTTTAPVEPNVLRATSVERELECSFREAQYRAQRWQRTSSVARMRGSAVHAAREASLRAWKDTGNLLPYATALDAGLAYIEDRAKDELVEDGTVSDAREEAAPFIEADAKGILPSIAPHVESIEERLRVPIQGGDLREPWILSGTLDVIGRDPLTRRLVIFDLKTSSKKPTQADINLSSQMSAYGLLVKATKGEAPTFAIDALRILKTKPKTVTPQTTVIPLDAGGSAVSDRVATERGEADYAAFVRRLALVLADREAGRAAPAALGVASACSRCVHRGHPDPEQRCPFVSAYRGGEDEREDA